MPTCFPWVIAIWRRWFPSSALCKRTVPVPKQYLPHSTSAILITTQPDRAVTLRNWLFWCWCQCVLAQGVKMTLLRLFWCENCAANQWLTNQWAGVLVTNSLTGWKLPALRMNLPRKIIGTQSFTTFSATHTKYYDFSKRPGVVLIRSYSRASDCDVYLTAKLPSSFKPQLSTYCFLGITFGSIYIYFRWLARIVKCHMISIAGCEVRVRNGHTDKLITQNLSSQSKWASHSPLTFIRPVWIVSQLAD